MQLPWFHIRGVCIAPGCAYRSSSAKRGMGIPGDHVKRVETYHHPLELAVVRELIKVRLPAGTRIASSFPTRRITLSMRSRIA